MVPNLALIAFMGGIIRVLQQVFKPELLKFITVYCMDQNQMLIMMKEGLVNFTLLSVSTQVGDQNLYEPGSSVGNIYRISNVDNRVGDQNLYGPGPSFGNMYRVSNVDTRVGDQNLYGPGPSVENIYRMSNVDTRVGDQNLHGP